MVESCENIFAPPATFATRFFGLAVSTSSTAIGYQPKAEDINLDGLDISKETVEGLLGVDKALWAEEAKGIREYYAKFGDKVPAELLRELDTLENNLK